MIITSVSPYVFSVRLLNTAESLWCLLIVDFRSVLVSGSNRNHGGLFWFASSGMTVWIIETTVTTHLLDQSIGCSTD